MYVVLEYFDITLFPIKVGTEMTLVKFELILVPTPQATIKYLKVFNLYFQTDSVTVVKALPTGLL